jgi:hypothetical protein
MSPHDKRGMMVRAREGVASFLLFVCYSSSCTVTASCYSLRVGPSLSVVGTKTENVKSIVHLRLRGPSHARTVVFVLRCGVVAASDPLALVRIGCSSSRRALSQRAMLRN